MKEIKDLLRKLKPSLGEKTRGLWYLNIMSRDVAEENKNRQLLDSLLIKS